MAQVVKTWLTITGQDLPSNAESGDGKMKLALFDALTDKMRWHQTRQLLLSQNVANAETPGFKGQDLKSFTLEQTAGPSIALSTVATQRGHIVARASSGGAFGAQQMNGFEVTPEGNAVTLEDEMMKVTTNQMDYQAVTTIYQRSMKLLKTALGRSA
jgi:flagellar basal-body rod protein FlgB